MFAGNSAVSGKCIYLSRSAALSKPPDYRMFASAAAYDGNIEFILCYLHFLLLIPFLVPSLPHVPHLHREILFVYVRLIAMSA